MFSDHLTPLAFLPAEEEKGVEEKSIDKALYGVASAKEYKKGGDNKEFQNQFKQLLEKLLHWGNSSQCFAGNNLRGNFQLILQLHGDTIHFFNSEGYHFDQPDSFFINIKYWLENIYHFIQDKKVAYDKRKQIFQQLAEGLRCASGLHLHVHTLFHEIFADNSFVTSLAKLRTNIIRSYGQKHIQEEGIETGSEAHVYNMFDLDAIQNGMAPISKVHQHTEIYPKLAKIEDKDRLKFRKYFKEHYTISRIADYFTAHAAEQYRVILADVVTTQSKSEEKVVADSKHHDSPIGAQASKWVSIPNAKELNIFLANYDAVVKPMGLDRSTLDSKVEYGVTLFRFSPERFKQEFLCFQSTRLVQPRLWQVIGVANFKIHYMQHYAPAFWIESPAEEEWDSYQQSKPFVQALITLFPTAPDTLLFLLSQLITTEDENQVLKELGKRVGKEFDKNVDNKFLYFLYLHNRNYCIHLLTRILSEIQDENIVVGCFKSLFKYCDDEEEVTKEYSDILGALVSKFPVFCKVELDTEGNFLLHYAADCGNIGLVERIHEANADKLVKNNDGETAAIIAAQENFWNIVELYLPHITPANAQLFDEVLTRAVSKEKTAIAQQLIDRGVVAKTFYFLDNTAALHCAVKTNNHKLLVALLASRHDINQRQNANSPTPLLTAACDKDVSYEVVWLLLMQDKVDLTCKYKEKNAFEHAASNQHSAFKKFFDDQDEVIRLFELMLRKNDARSAAVLLSAYYSYTSGAQYINLLVILKKYSSQFIQQEIMLGIARNESVVERVLRPFLEQSGETIVTRKDCTLITALWRDSKAYLLLNARIGKKKNTFMHLACQDVELFQLFFTMGADLGIQNEEKESVVYFVSKSMYRPLIDALLAMLKMNPQPEWENQCGAILIEAMGRQQYDLVPMLLELKSIGFFWHFSNPKRGLLYFAIRDNKLIFAQQFFKRTDMTLVDYEKKHESQPLLKTAAESKETDIDTLSWLLSQKGIHPAADPATKKTALQTGWEGEQPAFRQLLSSRECRRQYEILEKNMEHKDTDMAVALLTELLVREVELMPLLTRLTEKHAGSEEYKKVLAGFVEKSYSHFSPDSIKYLEYLAEQKQFPRESASNLICLAARHNSPQLAYESLALDPGMAAKGREEEKICPLKAALENEHVAVVKELVKERKDVQHPMAVLQDALVFLVVKGEPEAALALLPKCNTAAHHLYDGKMALEYALDFNNLELAKQLYKKDKAVYLARRKENKLSQSVEVWIKAQEREEKSAPSNSGLFGRSDAVQPAQHNMKQKGYKKKR